MKLLEKFSRIERLDMDWRRLLVQGVVIACTGAILALASVFKPDAVVMFARDMSWLPASGIVILSLGLLECLDAALAREQREFLQNLQVGVLDGVVGGLLLLSVGEAPGRLSLLLAAFLIVRGSVRIVLVYALRTPHALSTSSGGLLSVVLGTLIWLEWPTTSGWFLALCLNLEIAFRGWAIMMFALWVRKQNAGHLEPLP